MATIATAQAGNSGVAGNWVGGAVPGPNDVAQIDHVMTQSADHVWQDYIINGGGEFNISAAWNLTLTAGAGVINTGGSFAGTGTGTYSITSTVGYAERTLSIGNGGIFNPRGVDPFNTYTITGSAGNPFTVQDQGNAQEMIFTPRFCHLDWWGGDSNTTGEMALYYHGGGSSSNVNPQDCLITNYGRIRSPISSPLASAVHRFDRCLHINPVKSSGNSEAAEYTTASDFNAGTRGWVDCWFVGGATTLKQIYIDAGTAVWNNPLLVQNCGGTDILWKNRASNFTDSDFAARASLVTSPGTTIVSWLNWDQGQGGWDFHDTILFTGSTIVNAHTMTMDGRGTGAPVNPGVVRDSHIFAADNAANLIAFAGAVTIQNVVGVGGQIVLSTSNGYSEAVTINGISHIAQTDRPIDCPVIFETNVTTDIVSATNILVVGNGDATENVVANQNTLTQPVNRIGFNNYWGIGGQPYVNLTISDDQTANDLQVDPQLVNQQADIEDWDLSLGGPGTVDSAFNEMCVNLTGFDESGIPQIKKPAYTKANLLTYLRTNHAPQNPLLATAGDGGTVIGAIAYADTVAPVITMVGTNTVNVAQNSAYADAGATALDNVDGDITSSIIVVNSVDTNTVGSYTVTYNVSDAAGNAAVEVVRTVNVNDETLPTITLLGQDTVTLTVGGVFVDAGATAVDNNDGDLTTNIIVGGDTVNNNAVGSYSITYNVSDAAGNAAIEVIRVVNVVAQATVAYSGTTIRSKFDIEVNAQDVSVVVIARDILTGEFIDNLVATTPDLVFYYGFPNAAAVAVPLVDLVSETAAHTDGGIISKPNMPGVYRLDLPDAGHAIGNRSCLYQLFGPTNLEVISLEVSLVSKIKTGSDDGVLISSDVHTSGVTVANNAAMVPPDNAAIARIELDTAELQANQDNWLTPTGFSTFNPSIDAVNLDPDQSSVTVGAVNTIGSLAAQAQTEVISASTNALNTYGPLRPTVAGRTIQVNTDNSANCNMTAIRNTALVESALGRLAGNFGLLFDNADTVTTKILDDIGTGSGGGSGLWTQTEIDLVTAQIAAIDSRIPIQAIWDYISAHAAASQPVTFSVGTEITAIIATLDSVTAPTESGCINGRLLYFNNPTSILYRQMVRINAYDGGSKTVSFDALTSAVLETDTAILI